MINYIVHDVNASVDSKIKRLKMKHKMAGYGLYWSILEQLALSEDGKLDADFNVLGYEMRESAELVKSVICDFDLFEIDNGKFFSRRLLKSIEHIHSKSEKAKIAGIKSGEARRKLSERLTNVQQSFNKRSADVEQSKVKQSKVENIDNISIKDGGNSVQLLLPPPPEAKEESKAAKQEQIALEGDFNFFWTIYPKKKGKKEALRAYLKARKKASKDELLNALREIKAKEWKFKELQYVPNASTWLNQERWADEVQQEQKKADPLDEIDLETNPFDF